MNKIINKAVSIFIIFSLVLGLNVMNSLIVANAEEYVIDVANEKYGTTITAVPHTDKNTGEYSGGEAGDVNTLITDAGGMYAFGWHGNAASPYGYIQLEFEKARTINSIKIESKKDMYNTYDSTWYDIYVSNDPTFTTKTAVVEKFVQKTLLDEYPDWVNQGYHAGDITKAGTYEVEWTLENPGIYKYVRIQKISNTRFELSKISVFATETYSVPDYETENVALSSCGSTITGVGNGATMYQDINTLIDGSYSPAGFNNGSTSPFAYLQIELPKAEYLTSVNITSLRDAYSDQSASWYSIYVSNDSSFTTKTAVVEKFIDKSTLDKYPDWADQGYTAGSVTQSGTYDVEWQLPTPGYYKYIRIQNINNSAMYFKNISVYAITNKCEFSNAKYGSTITGAGNGATEYQDINTLIDGSYSPAGFNAGSTSPYAYMDITLPKAEYLKSVNITSLRDAYSDQSASWYSIYVSNDSNFTTKTSVVEKFVNKSMLVQYPDWADQGYTAGSVTQEGTYDVEWQLPTPGYYKYIRIQKINNSAMYFKNISVCGIETETKAGLYKDGVSVSDVTEAGKYKVIFSCDNTCNDTDADVVVLAGLFDENDKMLSYVPVKGVTAARESRDFAVELQVDSNVSKIKVICLDEIGGITYAADSYDVTIE